jgi:predicted O-linked N-acetylglucosamine transferase (SPINDLY family)
MSSAARQQTVERAMEHHRAHDHARAEALYREVLAEDGAHLTALHLLSALLLERGRNEEAAELLGQAVARAPTQAVFFANLGEAQRRLGRLSEAMATLKHSIVLRPDLAEAHHTLGLAMRAAGRVDEAVGSFQRCLAIKPNLVPAHCELAASLYALDRFDEARAAAERAVAIDPRCADAHNKLGVTLAELGRLDEAFACYRRAIACEPGNMIVHSNLVFGLPFHPDATDASCAAEARRWAQQHAGAYAKYRRPHENDRDPARRLRVGYVSPHFVWHCQALFVLPLLEHHDRTAVEVFCYSQVERPDGTTDRIRGLSTFRDIANLGTSEALDAIRRDRIDVLVDLTMHMSSNRLWLFAARPAPVQVAWLAYPGTTGLDEMDYRITDPTLDPPDAGVDDLYSEHSVRLPDSFWIYHPAHGVPDVGPLPASSAGAVTFGCLNSFKKINAGVLALWARVLRAVDGSRLILLAPQGDSRARTSDAFARAGVDPGRIEFVDYQPRARYLETYGRIDVCLDTFPSNGHTTSLDALWMGVPVVTLVGATLVGRAGLCYARNLGLPELVATDPDQFVGIACGLAGDLPRLASLRAELRERMRGSPLMDAPRFARHLEGAYRWMWGRWCEGSSRSPRPAK